MDNVEERQVKEWKDIKKKYGRNPGWLLKRYRKYRRKWWKDMEIMKER
jgi:hypothetical protein